MQTSRDVPRRAGPLWTEARVARLVELWNDRLSAARIARSLGEDVTRSAVVGKLFRLGLTRADERRYEAQAEGARRTRQCASGLWRGRRGPPEWPTAPLPTPTPCPVVPRLARLADLERTDCRWPYEHEGETRFCGHAARPGRSYCDDHHAIAYCGSLPPLTIEALDSLGRRAGGDAR